MGRLTKDPIIRYTQTNMLVASFTLAINRRFVKENEQQADFINIVAFGKTGEFVSKFFNKGQQVAVIGRIQTRTYDNAQGPKQYVTEVIAEETYFADSKKDTGNQQMFENELSLGNSLQDYTDDLPF